MVWVDSYQGFLPQSRNVETAPVEDGISGITHDGDCYCLDCAKEMNLVTIRNEASNMFEERLAALVKVEKRTFDQEGEPTGDTRTTLVTKDFDQAPWTGAISPHYESMTQYHCGRGKDCCNALSPEDHPYNHDVPVGIGIEQQVLEH